MLKMLGSLLILPAIFALALASGEFSVLVSPSSLSFKGNEKLDSEYLSDVFSASLGRTVSGNSQWGGLYISEPFNLPEGAIAVVVDGVSHLKLSDKAKTFSVVGDTTDESLNTLYSILKTNGAVVADLDLSEGVDKIDEYSDIFGDIKIPTLPKNVNNLKPDLHSEDKLFLQQIALINKLSENMSSLKQRPSLVIIRLSVTPIQTAHGEKSLATTEALDMLTTATENLAKSAQLANKNDVLVAVIATKTDSVRVKRQAATAEPANTSKLNLASYYSEDYPVIFNIILWFMVIFAFSLLAICYAIADMDPGRDSIIYRMTSTRMKKDN